MISGSPIRPRPSAAIRWWQASPISSPIPIAVPGEAQTKGLPPFKVLGSAPPRSILRSTACSPMTKPKTVAAGFSCFAASALMPESTLRSIPPAKSCFAEVMMAAVTASSASTASTWASSSSMPFRVSTFIEASGRSQVMVAMPSSTARWKISLIGSAPSDL